MKKQNKLAVVIGIVILAAVAAGVIAPKILKKGNELVSVPFAPATTGPLEEVVSASGSFQSDRYTVVSSKTVGIVKRVQVKPGDRVTPGDIIVVVDERDSRELLDSAEIALEETRRNISVDLASLRAEIRRSTLAFDQAQRVVKNARDLKAVDGVSDEELRKAAEAYEQAGATLADARDRLRVAEGLSAAEDPIMEASRDGEIIAGAPSYRKAQLNVEGARRALEGCVIKAGEPGTVTDVSVTTGTRLLVETTVARIEDPSSVMAEVNVDEVDIGKIDEGMKAEITADSMLGKTMVGTVSRIWPIVKTDGNGRVCKVRISLDLTGERFLSGASCMARITSVLRPETLTIPATALIPGAKPSAVWVAVETQPKEDAKTADTAENTDKKAQQQPKYTATRREVMIGKSTVSTLEVLSGLLPGELVVVDQLNRLSEGTIVVDANRIQAEPPK